MIKSFNGHTPAIRASCFVADNATVIGNVTLQEDASVWYGAVIRGDADALLDYLEQYRGEIGFFKEVDHGQSI